MIPSTVASANYWQSSGSRRAGQGSREELEAAREGEAEGSQGRIQVAGSKTV